MQLDKKPESADLMTCLDIRALKAQPYKLHFSIKDSIDIFSIRVENIFLKFMEVVRCIAFAVLIDEKMLNFKCSWEVSSSRF